MYSNLSTTKLCNKSSTKNSTPEGFLLN